MKCLRRQNSHLLPLPLPSIPSTNLNLVDPNLYLGSFSAARDHRVLEQHKITHILTIEDQPLPENIQKLKNITTKFIRLSDHPEADLLSYFDETYNFISEGVSKGVVLVHCLAGISRSATVVIAYIMKKYGLTRRQALDKVREGRSQVFPNPGFRHQLDVYHEMGCKTGCKDQQNKLLRLKGAAEQVRKLKLLPGGSFSDVVKPNPDLTPKEDPVNCFFKKYMKKDNQYYCFCVECNHLLASQLNLFTHKTNGNLCTKTYFLEPLEWMEVKLSTRKELNCPGCGSQIGGFDWIEGYQCPCDYKMSPAFYLNPLAICVSNAKNIK